MVHTGKDGTHTVRWDDGKNQRKVKMVDLLKVAREVMGWPIREHSVTGAYKQASAAHQLYPARIVHELFVWDLGLQMAHTAPESTNQADTTGLG